MRGRALLAVVSLAACACGHTVFVEEAAAAGHEVDDDAAVSSPPDASIADAGSPGDTGNAGDASDGASQFDAAGIPQLATCLASPYELQVVANNYGGLNGPYGVDGSQGTWSGYVESESILQLNINVAEGWTVSVDSDYPDGQALEPGTYTTNISASLYPSAAVEVDGMGCGEPTGTFTIVDLATTGGDEAALTRLVGWFDLACNDAGTLTGCVRYGE
jgi:hypothetical protein